ncbi:hypothetical protein GOP47_0014510 [Adiantum capillus-veneris]|uniref:Uncharacterized protein n=1 Tax=Adiantum capillus-veneris TaxID=13818 RepID=A0A9D4UMF4_ADICA|nr:hypothetical protein GOP47_0014510 [Adiantum capillus-veneris]
MKKPSLVYAEAEELRAAGTPVYVETEELRAIGTPLVRGDVGRRGTPLQVAVTPKRVAPE